MKRAVMYEQLDKIVRQGMDAHNTPCIAIALTRREWPLQTFTYGFANQDIKSPLNSEHLFAAGGVGAAFTAAAVLQACEAGLLNLYAAVQDFLPWLEVEGGFEAIRLHHLLTHTSGLPAGSIQADPLSSVLASGPLQAGFNPGEHVHVSQVGVELLALVLQQVYGKPYAQILSEQVLAPLEMNASEAAILHSARPRFAGATAGLYDDRPLQRSHLLAAAPWFEGAAAGYGLATTASDLARFGRMLLRQGEAPGGRLLSAESFAQMIRPWAELHPTEMMGYGVQTHKDNGRLLVACEGSTPGSQASLWLDVEAGLGAAVLMSQPAVPGLGRAALELLRAAETGAPLSTALAIGLQQTAPADDYEGLYECRGQALPVLAQGERLWLVDGVQRMALEHTDRDRFCAPHPKYDRFVLDFRRGPDGQVAELWHGPQVYQRAGRDPLPGQAGEIDGQSLAGHYRSRSPWLSNVYILGRKGALWLVHPHGDEQSLMPCGENEFRVGQAAWSPERARFGSPVDGRMQRLELAGETFWRSADWQPESKPDEEQP